MRIKEFSIIRYGPLSKIEHISLGNFNLLFGNNEEGKTLSIDALVKMLLGRNIKDFAPGIHRVEENPEGYVIIEDEKNKEIKLPEKRNITEMLGLTPSDCRNIFIIRDSDLAITGESEFYTNVTDRLTGLKTKQILSLKNKLKELGKLTRAKSTGVLSDNQEFGKIKSRLNRAKKLTEEIDQLGGEIQKEGFDRLEEESIRLREEIEKMRERVAELGKARKREKYQKGRRALDLLRRALQKSKVLAVYSEDDKQSWRDSERDINSNRQEKEKLLREVKKKQKILRKMDEELAKKRGGFRIFEERKKRLDEEIKPELKNYQIKRAQLASREPQGKFLTLALVVSVLLLGISLPVVIWVPSFPSYILTAFFLISTVIFGVVKFQWAREKGSLAGVLEKIKFNISRFELGAESPEGILSRIQEFEEEYQKMGTELEQVRGDRRLLESEIGKLKEERIAEIESQMESAQAKIKEIQTRIKEKSLRQYARKLASKLTCENRVEEQKSILRTVFGEKGRDLEENIRYWDQEIKALTQYKSKAEGIEYDEKSVSELGEQERLSEEKLRSIGSTMNHLQKRLAEIERKANEILSEELEEDYLYCKTSVDLEAIKKELEEFIDKNETNKDNVLKVMKIFEEIENEEKEKVSELFGKESSVAHYFNEITDGLYREVVFNRERGEIEVRRKDGLVLEAEKLSGGAYDQLYLSIRLALGEKILKGKKGFFIMDDPFIKASPDRLQRQMKVLRKISRAGWQIIYFTAKGEVKETLKEEINKGRIDYFEIKSSR